MLLVEIARRAVTDWSVETAGMWCRAEPEGCRPRGQGWKIHVSATPLSAPIVLARSLPVLAERRCAFKFAKSLEDVAELTGTRTVRSGAGKFLTAYPEDDEEFRRLAAALHEATFGIAGPPILSDRRYAPGSLVHYRYGVFSRPYDLTNDGHFEGQLERPDGTLEADRRMPWFSPPAWAQDPLGRPAEPARPRQVLLGGRFLVHAAIRQAYRGGVYRARDRETGREVIIKQARRHVGAGLDGGDVRDLLRREATMLGRVVGRELIALVEQDGDLFLVQDAVDGLTLEAWVHRQAPDAARRLEVAYRLLDLAERLEAAGLTCCDLNPSNLMVTGADEVVLIDLESLVEPGTLMASMRTWGYARPRQTGYGPAPGAEATRFGLGTTLFFLATGVHPVLAEDRRPITDRLAAWLTAMVPGDPLAPAALALTGEHSPAQARSLLGTSRVPKPEPPPPVERFLADGLDFLVAQMRPGEPRLWHVPPDVEHYDRTAVQYGAAGPLAVLARSGRHPEAVRTAADWISEPSRLLPGLYFGHSGTAWALLDAARTLGSEGLTDKATDLARRIPLPWPNPDICHGTAGAGMAQLRFWHATGDAAFLDRASLCADALIDTAEHRAEGVVWPIPASFDSALRGLTHYGFAHGVAGVGAFLLAMGRADCRALAEEAGATLVKVAQVHDGAAWWPSGERPDRLVHWCSGSSGVATFLLRLYQATGDRELLDLCELAACAIRQSRWHAAPVSCHGLAGDGDFLLDLADATGLDRYRAWAMELFECMSMRAVLRDGRYLIPDESGITVTAPYGTGLTGVLVFLQRLAHGGRRLWMDPSEFERR